MFNLMFLFKKYTFTLQECRENSDLVTRVPQILNLGRKTRSEVKNAETIDYNCPLLGYYVATSGNLLPTFQYNLQQPIFKGQAKTWNNLLKCAPGFILVICRMWSSTMYSYFCFLLVLLDPWRRDPIVCPETPIRNNHQSLRNNTKERTSYLLRCGSLKSRNLLTSADY
jgi:hypothetical protein